MAKPNKEQWEGLKAELSGVYGQVYLDCDGYLVVATIQKKDQRLVIVVYVDGGMQGKNVQVLEDSEMESMNDIQKKFMYHKMTGDKIKRIKAYEKSMGKKWCKANGIYKKVCTTIPWFNTPSGFLANIKKTCDNIEILDFTTYRARLDAKQEAENAKTV